MSAGSLFRPDISQYFMRFHEIFTHFSPSQLFKQGKIRLDYRFPDGGPGGRRHLRRKTSEMCVPWEKDRKHARSHFQTGRFPIFRKMKKFRVADCIIGGMCFQCVARRCNQDFGTTNCKLNIHIPAMGFQHGGGTGRSVVCHDIGVNAPPVDFMFSIRNVLREVLQEKECFSQRLAETVKPPIPDVVIDHVRVCSCRFSFCIRGKEKESV